MISDVIKSTFKVNGRVSKVHWFIDVSNTILPRYSLTKDQSPPKEAIEVLRWLSNRDDMVITIWTLLNGKSYHRLKNNFKYKYGINFDNYNGGRDSYHCSSKPIFDILLDDRAGFDIDSDWKVIKDTLIELGEWNNNGKITQAYRKT